MSRFPSLFPPSYEPDKDKKSDLLDVQVLEAKEKEYKEWLDGLYECPYQSPAGVRQSDYEDTEVDVEEESLEESSDVDNDISVFEDSGNAFIDMLDESGSLHDDSLVLMNDTP